LSYELYYREDADFLGAANLPMIINALIKQSAFTKVSDPAVAYVLNSTPISTSYTYNSEGELVQEGFEKFIVPIASLLVFFMAVFISSAFLLQSVSAEKENRMIETILSIVDKKSLMFWQDDWFDGSYVCTVVNLGSFWFYNLQGCFEWFQFANTY
jgi:hypothetical protein